MGIVYRAQDPAIGRTIAIKTIKLADLTDPSERDRMRERLFREAQSAGILSHPNIVTIYDILEQDGMAYIFMELVNGPTLEKMLGGEQPPDRQTLFSIFRQTASALDYAHRKGIIHRDIKPANVMVDEAGAAKITDFGVAKIASSQLTQSGMMMGTPSYMSPEQIEGGTVDGRADQFALAVIAYEVLGGEKPFASDSLASLLYKIVRDEPVAVHRLNSTLSPSVDDVLRKALSKSASDRHMTCVDFIQELEAACDARPGWLMPIRSGSVDGPTLATTGADTPPTILKREPPPVVVTAPASATLKEPVAPLPPLPPRPPAPPTHTARNVLIALVAVVVLAAVLILAQRSSSPPPAPVVTTEQTVRAEPEKPTPIPKQEEQPPVPAPSSSTPQTEPSETQVQTRPANPPTLSRPDLPAREVPMEILTSPGGAQITLDGKPFCTTPCNLPVNAGRHVIKVALKGYRDALRVFEAPADSTVTVDLVRMMGTLSVSSNPPGAAIYLNGQLRPEKTPVVLTLPVGAYKLKVEKENLKADEETVQISDGGMSQRRYILE